VLELLKQGIVEIDHTENFGVLEVRRIARTELDADSIADWDHDAAREVTPQEPGA
jgi:hypothetical protein